MNREFIATLRALVTAANSLRFNPEIDPTEAATYEAMVWQVKEAIEKRPETIMESSVKPEGGPDWHPGSEDPKEAGEYLTCYHFGNHPPVIHFYGVLDYYLADPKPHWQHTLGENGPTIDWWMPIPHTPDKTED